MNLRRNARAVSLLALLFALLTATAAFAEGGVFDDPPADEPVCEEVVTDDGTVVDGDEGSAEEPVEGEEECEPAEEEPVEGEPAEEPVDEGETGEEAEAEPADEEERVAACEEAAGIVDEVPTEGEETEEPLEEETLTGLDNAIDRVLANCIKNPQAPGLLNALEHLTANRERHEARMEAHAEWKAEKAEAQAAKRAEHEAWKAEKAAGGHGNAGSHGNGGGHGNGHGNPH